MNDHTPALTVCDGRLVKPKTDVVPLAETVHGVARAPATWSMVAGVHPGETPPDLPTETTDYAISRLDRFRNDRCHRFRLSRCDFGFNAEDVL